MPVGKASSLANVIQNEGRNGGVLCSSRTRWSYGRKRLVVGNAISLGGLAGEFMVAEDRRKPQIFTAPQAVIIQWPPRGTHLRFGHFLRLIIIRMEREGHKLGALDFSKASLAIDTAFIIYQLRNRHGGSRFSTFCYVLHDALLNFRCHCASRW